MERFEASRPTGWVGFVWGVESLAFVVGFTARPLLNQTKREADRILEWHETTSWLKTWLETRVPSFQGESLSANSCCLYLTVEQAGHGSAHLMVSSPGGNELAMIQVLCLGSPSLFQVLAFLHSLADGIQPPPPPFTPTFPSWFPPI